MLHYHWSQNLHSQYIGDLTQAQPCTLSLYAMRRTSCRHYICPFIPTPEWLDSPKNRNISTPYQIMPGRNVTIPPMIPTIVVAYNFSNTLGSRNDVEISFVMTHNASDTTTPIRLTRGGHDVVSYTLEFWEELDYGVFPSFWRILNPVGLRQYPSFVYA